MSFVAKRLDELRHHLVRK